MKEACQEAPLQPGDDGEQLIASHCCVTAL